MRKHRITDSDAAKLVTGVAPEAHPQLGELAYAIGQFRAAALTSAPQPTAALRAYVDLDLASGPPSLAPPSASTIQVREFATSRRSLVRRKRNVVFTWFVGLGVLAKIALGSTVALAAVAGVGMAGVLPGGSQTVFNHVVSLMTSHTGEPMPVPSETSSPHPSDDPVSTENASHPDNFGGEVSEQAKDPNKVGSEFGSLVSHEAHDKSGETGGSSGDNSDANNSGQNSSGDGGSSGNHGGSSGKTTTTPSPTPSHGHGDSGGGSDH